MPKYFFYLMSGDDELSREGGGEELAGVEEAQNLALRIASELARNVQPVAGHSILVKDDGGTIVFKTPLLGKD
jgi:hypothetical protein